MSRSTYDGGALVRRESDRDFDDQVDLVQEFDADTRQSVRSVTDVDFDGSADLLVLFDGGRPVYSRWKPVFAHADPSSSAGHSSTTSRRGADDRLGAFENPFNRDLAVRPFHVNPGPGDYVGVAQSGGQPQPRAAVARPLASAPPLSPVNVSLPSPAAVIPHSPRGPPPALFS